MLIVVTLICLFPLYWMLVGSLSNLYGILKIPPDLYPKPPTLKNYATILRINPLLGKWILNTVIVSTSIIGGNLVVTVMAAYGFAFYNFPGKRVILWAFLAMLMITRYSQIIPLYVLVSKYKLTGLWAAIIPTIFNPANIYMAYLFMRQIPKDFLEAARIDGAGEWRTLWQIVVPLCKPIISALLTFTGITALGDYMWQVMVLQRTEQKTMLIGLMQSIRDYMVGNIGAGGGAYIKQYGYQMAVGIILFLPMFLIYLVSSKYFIGGLTVGGIKE